MKILIIQHKMIGDVLITSLLCENIKKAYPNAIVDYLINSNTLPVLENNPYIDHKIVFDEKENKGLMNLIKFSKKVNQNRYDIVIDAYSKLQSWVDVFINNAPKKISYKKIGRTFLYTDNVEKHDEPNSYLGLAIEHRLSLLKPLGIETPLATEPKLYLTEEEINFAKDLFTKHQVDSTRKTVMISLLGSDSSKTYPLNEMAKMVDFIGQHYNVNILFNYFPKQLPQAKEVYNQLSDETKSKVYFELLGNDLREFIAIANECDVIVGNDGGAINMSKALGKKSFIIFSPWIDKKVWATFEDGINHTSVHLKDYFPEKLGDLNNRQIKKQVDEFYSIFDFELFKEKLENFLNNNSLDRQLISNNNVEIETKKEYSIESMSTKISALLITYNEEKNLHRYLNDVDFADEIIIIDSFSTDKTEKIARQNPKTKFVKRKFDNFTNQRNYGLSLAKNDWVTFFDADEGIPLELKKEIVSVFNQQPTFDAYFVYRKFFFNKKHIKYSGMQNDKAVRIFKKSKSQYKSDRMVHEIIECNGRTGYLTNKLDHFTFDNEQEYLDKLNSYSRLRAQELRLKNLKPTFYHYTIKPAYRFFNYFVMRLGFLDGKDGYTIAKLHAISVANRYKYLDEIYRKENQNLG
ncbi:MULTISPECIES: glycosyltransferase [Empedobacter]|uniref:Glycosyltransferase n=1 Tax=Empedobacter falsenii TaxID=343874 RepID=A0A7H9DR57_9FLAO|nr:MULTISPECIES: glycosyltransferase [Empedobacter]MDH2208493.1 glycosyltransferase [Empedobacter sp. GD03644]QLL57436.1 glycosyltransferase [Empedobacter falsenii]